MTADDMVSVPRELAERLLESAIAWDAPGDTALQLEAILNPPPEFDPEMVEAMAKARYELRHPQAVEWGTGNSRAPWRAEVLADLTAARDAGWEMVETTELTALRELVAASWDGIGDAFIEDQMTEAQADAIRKAKEAGQ